MVGRSAKGFMNIQDALIIDNEPFEVSRAADWLDGVIGAAECSPRVLAMLQVVLDEVLTNIMLHGYADLETHKIDIRLTADPSAVTLEFFDDGIAFDPTRHELPEAADTDKIRPGGLGILFIRKTMDHVGYKRIGGRNHLTLCKFLARD
jgi:serine/threonine-protein kinase RsbW